MPSPALLAVTLLLVGLAVGCGEGGEKRLSSQEFRRQGNAVCADVRRRVERLGKPSSLEDLGRIGQRVLRVEQDGIDRLRALRPPKPAEERFDALIATLREQHRSNRALVRAVDDRDLGGVQEHGQRSTRLLTRVRGQARTLGLEVCAAVR